MRDERTLGGIELGTLVRISSIASFNVSPGAICWSGVARRIFSLSRISDSMSSGPESAGFVTIFGVGGGVTAGSIPDPRFVVGGALTAGRAGLLAGRGGPIGRGGFSPTPPGFGEGTGGAFGIGSVCGGGIDVGIGFG